jgi:hypothetical protein
MNPIKGDLVFLRCFMIAFCLLFSSCTKQHSYRQKKGIAQKPNDEQDVYLDLIIQQEAMLVDIPVPLFDERIVASFSQEIESDTLTFGYKSPLSCSQAIGFFLNQMERLGWKHLVSFNGSESLLQFKTPDRYCTVVIKKSESQTSNSHIFIYIKRASMNACP